MESQATIRNPPQLRPFAWHFSCFFDGNNRGGSMHSLQVTGTPTQTARSSHKPALAITRSKLFQFYYFILHPSV